MQKSRLFSIIGILVLLLSIGLLFSFSVRAFSQSEQPENVPYVPVPILDQETAITVGKRIATTELAENGHADQVNLVSAIRMSSADYRQERTSSGVESSSWQQLSSDIWVVTLSGSFTPKRTAPGQKEKLVYNTYIIYLRADTGEVLGVSMKNE